MASHDPGRPLPKFGEWDVNNPASAEGFTVIFSRARDQKMSNAPSGNATAPSHNPQPQLGDPPKQKHCGYGDQCLFVPNTKGNIYLAPS